MHCKKLLEDSPPLRVCTRPLRLRLWPQPQAREESLQQGQVLSQQRSTAISPIGRLAALIGLGQQAHGDAGATQTAMAAAAAAAAEADAAVTAAGAAASAAAAVAALQRAGDDAIDLQEGSGRKRQRLRSGSRASSAAAAAAAAGGGGGGDSSAGAAGQHGDDDATATAQTQQVVRRRAVKGRSDVTAAAALPLERSQAEDEAVDAALASPGPGLAGGAASPVVGNDDGNNDAPAAGSARRRGRGRPARRSAAAAAAPEHQQAPATLAAEEEEAGGFAFPALGTTGAEAGSTLDATPSPAQPTAARSSRRAAPRTASAAKPKPRVSVSVAAPTPRTRAARAVQGGDMSTAAADVGFGSPVEVTGAADEPNRPVLVTPPGAGGGDPDAGPSNRPVGAVGVARGPLAAAGPAAFSYASKTPGGRSLLGLGWLGFGRTNQTPASVTQPRGGVRGGADLPPPPPAELAADSPEQQQQVQDKHDAVSQGKAADAVSAPATNKKAMVAQREPMAVVASSSKGRRTSSKGAAAAAAAALPAAAEERPQQVGNSNAGAAGSSGAGPVTFTHHPPPTNKRVQELVDTRLAK